MRRFLITSFITLALVVSAAGAAPAAYAAAADVQACIDNGGQPNVCECEDVGGVWNLGSNTCSNGSGATIDPAAANTPNPFGGTTPIDGPLAQVMTWIMSLFAWLVGVAAITLDNAVYYTVVTMGTYVNSLDAVGTTWSILRDLGNIMLIFGFLAIGISIILNTERLGYGKKMLPMLLVAAVFLNFSLFISMAVIDTGNLFATQFYTQINGDKPAGEKKFDPGFSIRVSNEGISNKLMSQLGLATIYSSALKNDKVLLDGTSVFIAFMSIILFLITAFVMFSLAFILIARFVILLFLIVIAPIGFAGLAIPQLASTAKKWWDTLFEQTITAPVLLLLLYIALAVITDEKFLSFGPKGDWAGFVPNSTAATNYAGFAGLMLSFLIAMGLLLAVIVFSKKLSAFGAAGASKLAGKLTFGATAFGMRSTAGWASNKLGRGLRNTKFGNRIATIPILGTNLTKAFEGIGKSSFDLRGTGVLKNIGIDAGKAQEGGWRKQEEEKIKARMEYAKGFTGRKLSESEKDTESNVRTTRDVAEKETNATKAVLEEDKKALDRLDKDLERMKRMQDGMSEQDSRYERLIQDISQKETQRTTAETRVGESTATHEAAKRTFVEVEKEAAAVSVANKEITSGSAAQKKYAENLTPQWLGAVGNYVLNPYRNTQATKKILAEAKKTKSERDLEKIKKFLEADEKKESGDKKEEKEEPKIKPEKAPGT